MRGTMAFVSKVRKRIEFRRLRQSRVKLHPMISRSHSRKKVSLKVFKFFVISVRLKIETFTFL